MWERGKSKNKKQLIINKSWLHNSKGGDMHKECNSPKKWKKNLWFVCHTEHGEKKEV